ncbi:ferritin-like domain-containing protein [Anthocerotibacter panamensis]|uniref:ferritin-like domain-containing protein n=1 Tax=Anthocerotibacter panamensis TaxID=2857077 RepID=UPI001C40497B|nr:ferritin-like domain-containing protein [Anthocerotibacter panamensis]
MTTAHGRSVTALEQVQESFNSFFSHQAFAQIARSPELKAEYLARLHWLESFAVGMLKHRAQNMPTRELQLKVARHAADEFKHAKWIGERLQELGYEPKTGVQDPYTAGVFENYPEIPWQQFFIQLYVAETRGSQDMEILKSHLHDDPSTCDLLDRLLADEHNHVRYLGEALSEEFDRDPDLLRQYYKTVWREKLSYLGAMTRIVSLYLSGNRDAIPATIAF